MDEFDLAALELQRDELMERSQKLSREMEEIAQVIKRVEAEYHRIGGKIEILVAQGAESPPKRNKKRTDFPAPSRVENPKRASVADAALGLIEEARRPLTRAELFEELTRRGLKIEGKNPPMVFSTMLWRERNRIARIRGFGYWPADKPYPPADYDPGIAQPSML